LTRKNTFYCRYGVFKVRVGSSSARRAPTRRPARRHESRSTVSQNSTAWNQRSRSTSFQASPGHRTAKRCRPSNEPGRLPG